MPRLSQVKVIVNRKSFIVLIFSLLTSHFSLLTSPVLAAPGGQPNPQPCANPMPTENLTDNYITDENGDPPADLRFFFTQTGTVGQTVNLSKNLEFKVDFSKLQAIFAASNSNNLEGGFQDKIHSQTNLLGLTNTNLMKFQGPVDKTSSKAWTDQLRTKYVEKIWQKPEIAESKNTFTDNNGGNPKTVYDLVTAYNLPKPPRPSEDQTQWLNTWGKYWIKIPTAYNEFTEGKLEFRSTASKPLIEKVKNGEFCPVPIRTVKFPVPNFFRTAAVSGQLNQVIVPKSAQSQDNNLILGGILGVKSAIGSIFQKCVKIITNNPFTNSLKKAVKVSLENLNPATPVYAAVGASGLSTSGQTCDQTTGLVNINFNWSPQPDGAFFVKDSQWLDLSLSNDNFTSSFINTSSPPSKTASSYTTGQAGGQIGPLDPAKTHYWRINTYNSLNGTWYPSPTASFTTINCSKIQQAATILYTSGQTCDQTTGLVNITFNWTPGQQAGWLVREVQWLDLSLTNDNFASAYIATSNPPSKDDISYTTDQAGGQIGPLDPAKTHYWRIGTHYLNENWYHSSTDQFTTINCSVGTLGATLLPTSNEACSGGQVNITFNWTPQPNGAFFQTSQQWLDLSTNAVNPFDPGNYINHDVFGASSYSTTTAPGNIGPLLPATTHYWRINTLNSLNNTWYPSATGTFTTINCSVGTLGATLLPTSNEACTSGQVNITFNWTPQPNGAFFQTGQQWLDLSTNATDPFGVGNYINHDVFGLSSYSTTTVIGNIGPLLPGTTHYWRINTLNSLNNTWYPSATGTFTTINCAVTTASCSINPGNITAGDSKTVTHNGFVLGESIRIFGINAQRELAKTNDSQTQTANQTVTIPADIPGGDYNIVIVTSFPAIMFTCTGGPFTVTAKTASWTVYPLKDVSCVKYNPTGKAGAAPYCAIYTKDASGNPNILPTDTCTDQNDSNKLNSDSGNVVCTFRFSWHGTFDIPSATEGDGQWDSCTPESGSQRTCYLTVGVWPDFRIPYLCQISNNTLYSDVKESCPTLQETGRPGVYTFFTPKAAEQELAKDPLQVMLDKCVADPTINGGCKDLLNYGATHSTEIPGYDACVGAALLDVAKLIKCFDTVTRSVIGKNLPGQVSNTLGAKTNVLGITSNSDQKERLIGGVECSKHFTRDVALKPKVLRQSLGIQQNCDLTSSINPPPAGSPPPPPQPPPPPPPGGCVPTSDGNPANGIETGRDELVCYITQVASGKVEKITGQPLDQVMIRVMDAESSGGNQCATAAAGEIGIFQYIAATWKTVGWDGGAGEDSGTVSPPPGNACWGTPGIDPIASTSPPPGSPDMFNWVANFGFNLDGDAWNPYHQIDATATEMQVSGGCIWSTFRLFFPGVCP